jgi:hypothetical protein
MEDENYEVRASATSAFVILAGEGGSSSDLIMN